MVHSMELERRLKGAAEQLKFEVKEADTENCKMFSSRVGMCSLCSLLCYMRILFAPLLSMQA